MRKFTDAVFLMIGLMLLLTACGPAQSAGEPPAAMESPTETTTPDVKPTIGQAAVMAETATPTEEAMAEVTTIEQVNPKEEVPTEENMATSEPMMTEEAVPTEEMGLKPTEEQLELLAGLPVIGPPPELHNEVWLNSDPLRLAELKGKVVIVEFWTYG